MEFQRNKAEQKLRDGLEAMQITLSNHQQVQLLTYLELLYKWNKAYNLTAINTAEDMVSLHLLDSLAIIPFLKVERFIDVGTGAGLPGIPLAIALPDKHFTLLDSNGKRIRFLFQVRTTLGLTNATEIKSRAEDYQPQECFEGVISRAFSSVKVMVKNTAHLCCSNGVFYAMKGRYPQQELSELQKPYTVTALHKLQIPSIEGERHLLEIGIAP